MVKRRETAALEDEGEDTYDDQQADEEYYSNCAAQELEHPRLPFRFSDASTIRRLRQRSVPRPRWLQSR